MLHTGNRINASYHKKGLKLHQYGTSIVFAIYYTWIAYRKFHFILMPVREYFVLTKYERNIFVITNIYQIL